MHNVKFCSESVEYWVKYCLLKGCVVMKKKIENKCGDYTDPKIQTDPFGSYTGVPKQRSDKPVQDVDDL